MNRKKICIVGGTGFVGGHLLRSLSKRYQVIVLSRNPSAQREHWVVPHVRFELADVYDSKQLARHFDGAVAVINLVGILHEAGSDGVGFRQAHVTLVERILDACAGVQVARFLHVSALHAGQGESLYLRTKGEAENLIEARAQPAWTIFQPSVIFGPGDGFLNRFADLLRMSPVLPQPCPEAKFQPVYVGDVVAAIELALQSDDTIGQRYQLAGPRVYSMLEVIDYLRSLLELKRVVIGLPDWLSRVTATLMGLLPAAIRPFSKDNYHSLQVDSVATDNGLARLGVRARSLEAIAPKYITTDSSPWVRAQRYQRFRERAGRGTL